MQRRELFRILSAGMASCAPSAAQQSAREPRFFSRRQYELIRALCDIIIPADEHSPGAAAAGVGWYVDTVLLYSDAPAQQAWRRGMDAVERAAQEGFGAPFLELKREQQETVVSAMARNEGNPASELERFFLPLKRMTVDGYHLSEAGMRHLGYKGNTAVSEFPGCTHPEHQR